MSRRLTRAFVAAATIAPVLGGAVAAGAATPRPSFHATSSATDRVIIQGLGARAGVAAVHGTVTASLPIIEGVAATVPRGSEAFLRTRTGIRAVTANSKVHFEANSFDPATSASSFVRSSAASSAWKAGNYGKGIGVAVLDTGISSVPDLAGRVVHGPDLSGEGSSIDTYGHGTVMAGIVGGDGTQSQASGAPYTGVAPQATVIGVKLAGANGLSDVSTILEGMDWVSAYAGQFNIRVVNMSFGLPTVQSPLVDPVDYAVERLWKQGIVVVASAGNSGPGAGTITTPGADPVVLTAGAYDDNGTTATSDDVVPAWSSQGPTAFGNNKPDVVAPGRHIVSTTSYGSNIEVNNPQGWVGADYIKGSGTSQAAAVTSGLVALLLAARPNLTPDQVKWLFKNTANPIAGVSTSLQGAGRVQLQAAINQPLPLTSTTLTQVPLATGLGSLETDRVGVHPVEACNGTPMTIAGEVTAECQVWNPVPWTGTSWTGTSWTGTSWTGTSWTGTSWTDTGWTGTSWTGTSWTGGQWTGTSWTGTSWTGTSWTGTSWTGTSWTGTSWTGTSWTGTSWTGTSWTGNDWDGTSWTSAFWGEEPPPWHPLPGEQSYTLAQYLAAVVAALGLT